MPDAGDVAEISHIPPSPMVANSPVSCSRQIIFVVLQILEQETRLTIQAANRIHGW